MKNLSTRLMYALLLFMLLGISCTEEENAPVREEEYTGIVAKISPAYVPQAEESVVESYDPATGEVQMSVGAGQAQFTKNSVTVLDLDTMGYVRIVTSVKEENGKTILQTTEGSMEHLFIDKSFTLSTIPIEPKMGLRSRSEYSTQKEYNEAVSRAFTSSDRVFHPVEIIYAEEDGISTRSVNMLRSDRIEEVSAQDTIIDFNQSLKYELVESGWGWGNNLDLGITSKSYFKLGLCSEITFDFKGDDDLDIDDDEKLELKKGDLHALEFMLVGKAETFIEVGMNASKSVDKDGKKTLPDPMKGVKLKFMVGPVPVWIDIDADLIAAYKAEAGGEIDLTTGFFSSHTVEAGVRYLKDDNEVKPFSNYYTVNEFYPPTLSGSIFADARVEVYPKISVMLYGAMGPHCKIIPYLHGGVGATSLLEPISGYNYTAWDMGVDVGVDLEAGISFDFILWDKEFNTNPVTLVADTLYNSPHKIELLSKVPDEYSPGETIPLSFKVSDNLGNGVPSLGIVVLEADGKLNKYTALTNKDGIATVEWTPSGEQAELTARINNRTGKAVDVVNVSIETTPVNLPTVTTGESLSVTETSANLKGTIGDNGGADITRRGFYWATHENPGSGDTEVVVSGTASTMLTTLHNLQPGTTYYYVAFATNSAGTAVGSVESFTTPAPVVTAPTVISSVPTSITQTAARLNGKVNTDGGSSITKRGFYWATHSNPANGGTEVVVSGTTGNLYHTLSNLTPDTKYYYVAFATNSKGTTTGSVRSFTTEAPASNRPTVATNTATGVTQTTANLKGTISDDGGATITRRGFYLATHNNPGSGDTEMVVSISATRFISSLRNLTPGTIYYYRAFATNSAGTAMGSVQTFTTTAAPVVTIPTVVTDAALSITQTTADLKGTISDDGGSTITKRGFYWATHNTPGSGDTEKVVSGTTGVMQHSLTGLTPGTIYYYRAFATNSAGTAMGSVQTFTTTAAPVVTIPTVVTDAALSITQTTADLKGTISDDGGAAITKRGFYWATHNNPGSSDNEKVVSGSASTFISALSGLAPGTTYYYRAFATNSSGTATGSVQSFTTLSGGGGSNPTGTVTDVDGNTYNTVKIGDQWWMAENLKVTQYADGTAIPHITDNNTWAALGDNNTDKAYCFYNNNAGLGYGALYTFAAATNGTPHSGSGHVQGVCPAGWHLPSDAEWQQLEDYMIANGYNYDGTTSGNKIGKALASKTGWQSSSDVGDVGNNPSTNNSSGFNALPGGYRDNGDGSFDNAGYYGFWWSSTQGSSSYAYYRYLWYYYPSVYRGNLQ